MSVRYASSKFRLRFISNLNYKLNIELIQAEYFYNKTNLHYNVLLHICLVFRKGITAIWGLNGFIWLSHERNGQRADFFINVIILYSVTYLISSNHPRMNLNKQKMWATKEWNLVDRKYGEFSWDTQKHTRNAEIKNRLDSIRRQRRQEKTGAFNWCEILTLQVGASNMCRLRNAHTPKTEPNHFSFISFVFVSFVTHKYNILILYYIKMLTEKLKKKIWIAIRLHRINSHTINVVWLWASRTIATTNPL